ncbi:hypothetical protein [Shewanella cutis]|uniref:DUF4239 domain-containing protein n=1 Tax=Shewanella cutis TaxID=2766780 RepID=A0ABS9QZ07_9GAMM|nr:hypothetical protein [Shewanella sp. PS-2]MCG9965605.1 hypothetical protein [Shewanella sp. PS-2]
MFNFNPIGLTSDSIALFFGTFTALFISALIGNKIIGIKKSKHDDGEGVEDFRVILGATLSLLGLIIGFTLSMSIAGFNTRQAAEENEAFVIRTGYMRADLLPKESSALMKFTIKKYLQKRIDSYDLLSSENSNFNLEVIKLQRKMWDIVVNETKNNTTPITSLVVSNINEIVLAQQKTLAGWRHQIPYAAWFLLISTAIICNILVGYNARKVKGKAGLLLILPTMISLSFLMISEIDAPGRGVIKVSPTNLQSLITILNSEL